MISSDANWDGIDHTELLTLDLSAMRFISQRANDPGFITQETERAGFTSFSFGNDAGGNVLTLSECGRRLAFCLSDCEERVNGSALVLLEWTENEWAVKAVLRRTLQDLISSGEFVPEEVSRTSSIKIREYQPIGRDAPIPASEIPESLKWKLAYFNFLRKHRRV